MSNALFYEITEEEIGKYISDIAGDSEEYKEMLLTNTKLSKIKEIEHESQIIQEEISNAKSKIVNYECRGVNQCYNKMFSAIKAIWQNLRWLYQERIPSVEYGYGMNYDFFMDTKDINICEIDGAHRIILPTLIPRRKDSSKIPEYANNYRVPIHDALERKFPGRRPYQNRACIIIVHLFSDKQGSRPIIDYDNFDYSHLINCLASFFLVDDDPNYYSLHIVGKSADKEHTEVFIGDDDDFIYIWDQINRLY